MSEATQQIPVRQRPPGGESEAALPGERAASCLRIWTPVIRELLKIVVIVAYLAFAVWLLAAHGNPVGFVPLLPWALRGAKERLGSDDLSQNSRSGIEDEAPDRAGSG